MSPEQLALSVYAPPAAGRYWRLEELVGHDRVRFFSLGRRALAEALRLAGAGPKRPALLPSFVCREVLSAAADVGAPTIFYPVTPELGLGASPADLPAAAAVVAIDYFGFPQDLAPFEAYARRAGATVVEDNAHGLFSRDGSGRSLGARAPLGVFSLRKSLPLPNGGALAVNDQALFAAAAAPLPFAAAPRGRRRLLRALSPLLGARGTLRLIRLARTLKGRSGPEDPGAGRPEPCAELSRPIALTDAGLEAERRRGLYALCDALLSDSGARPVFPRLPEGTVPYAYPFRAAPEAAAAAEARLAAAGLFSLPWPDLPEAVAKDAPPHYRDVRLVHFRW